MLQVGRPDRPIIVVLARQHPGETFSNFVLQGFMEELCLEKQAILQHYSFLIVPMVNVDGCIYGNFRSNLTGVDLNRKWTDPDKLFTPQVCALKNLLEQFKTDKRKVSYFIDLHGHSRDLGTFIYSSGKGKKGKLLPYLMGQYNESFNRSKCTFGICPSKEDTARANIYWILNCQSITVQSSFYGYRNRENELVDYYPPMLQKLGCDLLKCIMMIHSKSELPLSQQLFFWTNSSNSLAFIQGKFSTQSGDVGSDEDPTADYIQEIQGKITKIKHNYRHLLENNNTQVKPIKVQKIQKKVMTTPMKSVVRRRVASSVSRLKQAVQITTQQSSTILKKHPNTFAFDSSLEVVRKHSRPKSKHIQFKSMTEFHVRLSKMTTPQK